MNDIINKPDSWIEMNVSDIIQKISTNRKKIKQKKYLKNGSLPIIDQGSNYIGGYTNNFSKKIDCELPVIVFGDHTKAIKFVNFNFAPGADGVKVIKPISSYNPKLFGFFLKVLISKIPDKGYARHFQYIEKTRIPLPPLPEQNQIVAKIEELFIELDNGIENLKKAREQLKTYRQAVLKYAFEGKLTKEWRNVNNVYNNNYLTQLKFKIDKFNDNKSGQDLPRRLPPIDLKKLESLPFGWVWIEAHKICQSVRDGTHDTPKYIKTGIPLVTSKNLRNGKVDFSNIQFISEKDHIEINKRSSVESGDILFGMIGTIGNSVIISSNNNFSIKNVGLFKKNPELILSKYLKYWLDSSTLFKMLEGLQLIRGTTQKFISLGSLRVLPIPCSSIEEQHAIISEIESRLSVCDKIEQTIGDSLKKAEALRQSILKKAFSGELTRDWREKHPKLITGENSAEKLLEKIKTEKALAAGRKKPRSKKAKKK
jgi:type I restriction enzyme S subunit